MAAALAQEAANEQAANTGPFIQTRSYSATLYEVPDNQPEVPVTLDAQGRYADTLRLALQSVPIPPQAHPAAGTDGHMVVWQRATDRMWEFWRARRAADGWHAAWGGVMEHVSRSPGYFTV